MAHGAARGESGDDQAHAVLSDPDFLRDRLVTHPPKDFEDFSSAYKYTVFVQLSAWARGLGR